MRIVLALMAVLLGCAAPESPAAAGPPKQLVIPGLTEYERPNATLIPGRLFPLGWSRDGKLAYVYEPPDEACGCYFFRLVVQDLVSDKVLWEYKYDSGDLTKPGEMSSMAEVWGANSKDFEARLRSFGIVRSDAVLQPLSSRLEAAFHTSMVTENPFGFPYISAYEIEMRSPQGAKTIFKSGQLEPGPLKVSSPGYFASPFEERIAVVVQETWRGWEGPPHTARFRLVGCHLRTGWR
ncbi:MAG: hypothetical protein QOH06_3497 [Acidobacteriota bacterium]|jgi:hypothetical protein|nr:hypothetical protein [Acidobacteriota bacterium]